MKFSGTLNVQSGESSLDGTLLAIEGDENPLGAATDFLANRDLFDEDRAEITGNKGPLGTEVVIFMTDAQPAAEAHALKIRTASRTKSARGAGKKKSAKKAGKKQPAKRIGKKKSAKKSGKKKSAKARVRQSESKKTSKQSPRKK